MSARRGHVKLVIMGKMAAGKTHAAEHMVRNHDATLWTISERIKQVSHALIDGTGQLGQLLEVVIPGHLMHEATVALLAYADRYEEETGKARRLYQDVGQILRDLHPETGLCWEEDLQRRIESSPSTFTIVDIRSKESHAFFVDQQDFASLRIKAPLEVRKQRMQLRDGSVPVDPAVFEHQSETETDHLHADYVINNDHMDEARFFAEVDEVVAQLRLRFGS